MFKVSAQDIVDTIMSISAVLEIEPTKVTLKDLAEAGISERQVRNNGGLDLIRKSSFPNSEKNLKEVVRLKADRNYVSKLEKQVGLAQLSEEKMVEVLKKVIVPIKSLPKFKKASKKKVKVKRELVAMLNDFHFGLIVDSDEVNGTNKFNWEIAGRRTALFAQQVADYKIEKRHETKKLHVVINGDGIQGLLHDVQSKNQELLGIQQNGAMHILTYFIGYVSQFFEEVEVYCNHGNHEDAIHRREGGRITSHKSKDSFMTPVYYGLSLAFRNIKHVKFTISKSLHVDINLPAGRAAATHGDTLFSKQLGNPGSSLNVKGLSDALNRWNSGEIEKGNKKVKLWLFGHVHSHSEFTTFDGVRVMIAPSLSGVDSYAHSLAINHNQIGQMIFESTEKHMYGDSRLVNLLDADNDKSLDKIIPLYKGELKWSK
jgi:hypothetical protein